MNDPTSLALLHPIVLPGSPSLFPPAPGWYMLGIALFYLVLRSCCRAVRQYRKNRYRRQALFALDQLEKEYGTKGDVEILRIIPRLLKWAGLQAYPASEVASLTGREWGMFLQNSAQTGFPDEVAHHLALVSSSPSERLADLTPPQVEVLFFHVRQWISSHRGLHHRQGRGNDA